jgi:hypothetical protein
MNQDDNKFRRVEWSGDQYSPAHDDLDELPAPPARSLSDDDLALLKLAALAIGCVLLEEVEGEEYVNLHFADGSVMHAWNPLAFSGDAFDLAATLEFDIMHRVVSRKRVEILPAGGPLSKHFYEGDVIAATRRAVVLAAAEIGRHV